MAFAISRYLEEKTTERKEFLCEVITPLFLGNADQEAELRSAPFKGLIRYWWRVAQHQRNDTNGLLLAESKVFGSAGDDGDSGRSRVKIVVQPDGDMPLKACKDPFPTPKYINHPEVKNPNINPLLYLACMGLMKGGTVTHSYFPSGTRFKISYEYPGSMEADILPAFCMMQAFGTIGSRSRNGWGSIQVFSGGITEDKITENLSKITIPWDQGMQKDYPHCLGKDSKGVLLWATTAKASWSEAMLDLADAYVAVRARTVEGIGKLSPGSNNLPDERHLLGIPLTNHKTNWGNNARHASPLRFFVRRQNGKYRSYILHLPHSFSTQKRLPATIDQSAVWEKVHKKLDGIAHLTRAKFEDCL